MILRSTLSKIIFIAFIAISLMAALSITTQLGGAQGFGFTQCSDGINNDPLQDDLIDANDPGCHTDFNASNFSSYDPNLNSEFNPSQPSHTPECRDGIDNDGDGFIDWPSDPRCSSPDDDSEFPFDPPPSVPECRDGIDNDGDGFIDLADPRCDHRDDDSESPFDPPSSTPECRDGIDNDGDGFIDFGSGSNNDPSCSSLDDNSEAPFDGNNNGSLSCSSPSFSIDSGDFISFDLHSHVSGNNSNLATFSTSNRPSRSNLDNNTGVFSWDTDNDDDGNYTFSYSAFQGANSCSGLVNINVDDDFNNDDLRVTCKVDDRRVDVGESVRFQVDIDDGDSPYDIDWRGDINGNDRTERVSFNRPGTYEVSVRVEDDRGDRDTDHCPDVIVGSGGPTGSRFPFFTTIAPTAASPGSTYIYDSNAIDPDGTTVTYSLISGPSGMTISPINGLVQWIPTSVQANQSHFAQIRATDRSGDFAFQNFSIFVQGPILPPPLPPGPPQPPVADLEIFDLRVDNDDFNNVIASYRTNIPANSRVYYSLNSHFEDRTTTNYENQLPGPNNTTFHQVNLGQLEVNRTYYLRAFASTNNDSDLTSELAFVLLPNGVVAGTNTFTTTRNYRLVDEYALVRIIDTDGVVLTDRNDAGLATALAVIGSLLLNPWFLLLIIIILLVILLLGRGKDTYISSGGSGPVEIRS